ncbi:MAG: 1-acyl-sn-glycerol-3-phosphate acyltransferase [Bacteroidetes bacterium]|jgi:1-acyl-sn-glycerol-3-phosphate acyltransferase|nr:1-acyl-sn-glycerol-3-phosphate acyltransferase [Bacteroidota bacterium]
MNYVRTCYRLLGFVVVTLWAGSTGIVLKLFGASHERVFLVYNSWKWLITRIMNIQVQEEGIVPLAPGIIMANHRSYIDVALTPSAKPFVIVAKKSVKRWPLVGLGGKAMRTIWVDRDQKESRSLTRMAMKDILKTGGSVLIFPEGTTDTGPGLLEPKQGMFHVCAEGRFPIHPLAIEYDDPNLAWVGNDLFIPHFIKHFGRKSIRVKLRFGPSITGGDGQELLEKTYYWLNRNLREMRLEWDGQKAHEQ